MLTHRNQDSPCQEPTVFFIFSFKPHKDLHHLAFHVAVGRNPMSASSPPSLPRAFLHSLYPHHPSSPSPSPSPPGPLYTRLSNGSHSIPSPTNSRGSFHGVSFLLQIGLTRETVNLEASDLSLSAVKDLVCSIVDQKVRAHEYYWQVSSVLHLHMLSYLKRLSESEKRVAVEGQHNAHQHKFTCHNHLQYFKFCAPKQTSGPCAP